jgi:putative MFS transporter
MSAPASVATIIPPFTYLAAWYVLARALYYFLGIETNQRSIEEIDRSLIKDIQAPAQQMIG